MKRKRILYDDETKKRAIEMVKVNGYKETIKQMEIGGVSLWKWCRKAGVKSPLGLFGHKGNRLDLRQKVYQIDGCIFKIDPKWFWLTIAAEELPVMVRDDGYYGGRIKNDYHVTPNDVEYFLREGRLRVELFNIKSIRDDRDGLIYQDKCRSIIDGESFEDFQRLILEKYVEVFTELSKKNRHKYFRTISVKPLDQDH